MQAVIHYHAAPELEEGHELSLSDMLADRLDLPEEKHAIVLDICERESQRLAAEKFVPFVKFLISRLKGFSSAGAALSFAIGATDLGSIAAVAETLGVSKQGIGKQIAALRPLFDELHYVPPAPIIRPTVPGDWLTRPEAGALVGRRPDNLIRWNMREERVNGRVFYDKAEVLKQDAERRRRAAIDQSISDTAQREREIERAKEFSNL